MATLPGKLNRITVELGKMGGKPGIRGLRVTVGAVLSMLAGGSSPSDILEHYPYLQDADIQHCLAHAA